MSALEHEPVSLREIARRANYSYSYVQSWPSAFRDDDVPFPPARWGTGTRRMWDWAVVGPWLERRSGRAAAPAHTSTGAASRRRPRTRGTV